MSDTVLSGVTPREAFRVWVTVAIHSFGGPAGQIGVIHRLVVDEKKWLSESRFLHALSYCMLLPGPEAQQLATYVGWLLHGVRGGLIAGGLFILPGFLSILALSILYAGYRDVGLVAGLFFGLKPAVMAVVFEAVLRLRRRALKGSADVVIAGTAFIAIFAFGIPFPLIVIGAALVGYLVSRAAGEEPHSPASRGAAPIPLPSPLAAGRTAIVWLIIWLVPLGVVFAVAGPTHVFAQIGLFFSKAAVVTFGGAYSVLAYVAQQAVESHHWLAPGEMLDGLGMAETTPGPLVQVVQFVGFMGAYRNAGALDPMVGGVIGSVVTTWVTFAPCFLFIFVGAPYVEYLRENVAVNAALRGITAAVVGVVLNLGVWFALHTLFGELNPVNIGAARLLIPSPETLDWRALVIAIGAMVAMFRFKVGMIPTLAGAAVLGVVMQTVF